MTMLVIIGLILGITFGALTDSRTAKGIISFTLPQNLQAGFSSPIEIFIDTDTSGAVYYNKNNTYNKVGTGTNYLYRLQSEKSKYLQVTFTFPMSVATSTGNVTINGATWTRSLSGKVLTCKTTAKVKAGYVCNIDALISGIRISTLNVEVGTIEVKAVCSDTTTFNENPISVFLNYTTGFSGGSGTEAEPYLISSSHQLTNLSKLINDSTTNANYTNKHYKLINDINFGQCDEVYTFDTDTGLYQVTKGNNVIYIGTGIKGDNTGSSTTFDTTASTIGAYYTSNTSTTTTTQPSWLVSNWTPIGTSSYKFSGTFNGNNCTISGINCFINSTSNIYAGLFGYVNQLKISSLVIDNSNMFAISSKYVYAGAIIGYVSSGGEVEIINSTNFSTINGVAGNIYSSGFVGYSSSSKVTIMNACNNGSLNVLAKGTYAYTGGICGSVGGGELVIDNCINSGYINILESSAGHLGGLVAQSSATTIITNSINNGSLKDITIQGYLGGLVGKSSGICTIANCYNNGSLYMPEGTQNYVGGLSGNVSGDMTVIDFNNSGNISINSKIPYAGGLIGDVFSDIKLTNCYNYGGINYISSSNTGALGGLIGRVFTSPAISPSVLITNCISNCVILSKGLSENVGALVGTGPFTNNGSFGVDDLVFKITA